MIFSTNYQPSSLIVSDILDSPLLLSRFEHEPVLLIDFNLGEQLVAKIDDIMVVTRNEENTVNVRGSIEQSDGIMGHSVCLTRDENTLGNLALLEHNCIQNYDMSRNDTAEVTRGATASRKRRREERVK